MPGPKFRRKAWQWQQEICAARSLGKPVFRDKNKIATKARKLHYFGKFMEFMMLLHSLVLKIPTLRHSVHKSLKHTKVKIPSEMEVAPHP